MNAPEPLRVGYVLKRFPRLSQTFVLNEIAELQRQGVEVTVIARHSPQDDERLPHGFFDVPVHYLDAPRLDILTALRNARVEHLHAHFATWAAATAQQLAADLGVTFSFTAHAHDIYHQSVDRHRLAVAMALAEFVVTVSEANRQFLHDLLVAERRQANLVRLYNGVDLTRLRPGAGFPVAGRIVAVGRLVPKKGLTYLIEACRRLKSAGQRFECVIAGEGEEREVLERQIAAGGLQDVILLAGALSHGDTLDLLRTATACVLPCVIAPDGDRDGLPTVLLEALALGVPVVSTTVSGVPEIVTDGESGLLVPPSDAAALATAIAKVLSSKGLRARLAIAGTARARREFSLATNVGRLKDWFVAAATPRRVCA